MKDRVYSSELTATNSSGMLHEISDGLYIYQIYEFWGLGTKRPNIRHQVCNPGSGTYPVPELPVYTEIGGTSDRFGTLTTVISSYSLPCTLIPVIALMMLTFG